MMKRITSFMAAAFVASIGLCSAQEEDYTSYLKNPGFNEGYSTEVGDTVGPGYRQNYIIAPKDWKATQHQIEWGFMRLFGDDPTPDQGFGAISLTPYEGVGYIHHGIAGGHTNDTLRVFQTIDNLPMGKYRLGFVGIIYPRAGDAVPADGFAFAQTAARMNTAKIPYSQDEASGAFIVPTEWKEGSVEFAQIEDNSPVTVGFQVGFKTAAEQLTFMDNFTLFRIGDVQESDIVNDIYYATEETRIIVEGYEFEDYVTEEWKDEIRTLVWDDNFTLAEANAYEEKLNQLLVKLNELADVHDSILTLVEEAKVYIEETNYAGVAEYKAIIEAANDFALTQSFTTDQAWEKIAEMETALRNYRMSAFEGGATYENPLNATFLIVNPTIEGEKIRDPYAVPGWYIHQHGSTQPNVWQGDKLVFNPETNNWEASTGTFFNTWNGNKGVAKYTTSQEIKELPTGIYRLKALVADDGLGGAYLYAESGDIYFSTEHKANGAYLDTVTVDNIIVTNGTLTIGITNEGDSLWGGKTATGHTFITGDNFELYYCGADLNVLKDVLSGKIQEVKDLLAATPAILKGDKATVEGVIAAAEKVLTDGDLNDISAQLSALNNQAGIMTVSAAAIESVQIELSAAQDIYDADNKYFNSTEKAALEDVLLAAKTWIDGEESVASEAESLVEEIKAALLAAQKSGLTNQIKDGPCDATFLIVNPDLEFGDMTGWKRITGNTGFEANYGFEDGASHSLYFWAGTVEDASKNGFENRQTIYNLPNGKYKVTARGFYGAADEGDQESRLPNDSVVFFAYGDVNDEVQVNMYTQRFIDGDTVETDASSGLPMTDPDTGEPIYKSFYDSRKVPYELTVNVTHGWLRIGYKSIGQMNCRRAQIDDFTLTYLEEGPELPYPDAIEDVNADKNALNAYAVNGKIVVESEQPYTITSVSGQAYDNNAQFAPGVYVVKTANATVKVVVD